MSLWAFRRNSERTQLSRTSRAERVCLYIPAFTVCAPMVRACTFFCLFVGKETEGMRVADRVENGAELLARKTRFAR